MTRRSLTPLDVFRAQAFRTAGSRNGNIPICARALGRCRFRRGQRAAVAGRDCAAGVEMFRFDEPNPPDWVTAHYGTLRRQMR